MNRESRPGSSATTAIVLAAGQGTRMKSALPKVMHPVCGLPIVHFGVQAALDAGCEEVVVVVGHGRALLEEYLAATFPRDRVKTVVQEHQRGTGDAARVGLAGVTRAATNVLVMNGDVPLVRGADLRAVLVPLEAEKEPALAFAVCVVEDPTGYGRIMRDGGRVVLVREHRDLRSPAEQAVREINAGIYAASIALLREALASLTPNNAQGELYLTDVVAFASNASERVITVELGADVLAGVNDREQLEQVDRMMQSRIVTRWRREGATVRHGARVEALAVVEADVAIEAGAVLRGRTHVRRGASVDVGCVLTDVDVGEGARVKPYSVATDARIGARAHIGPFAHLRPGSDVGDEAHVGNFVETKKTRMGRGAKANHLAYLGDGDIGAGANVGAGTIFCNYDGFRKHTTTIGEGAFIGSDSQIVAPVTIGAHAYVATGTTVTRDVPPDALAIGRTKQENKAGYASRLRARLQGTKPGK